MTGRGSRPSVPTTPASRAASESAPSTASGGQESSPDAPSVDASVDARSAVAIAEASSEEDDAVPSGPPDDATTTFEDLPHDLFGEDSSDAPALDVAPAPSANSDEETNDPIATVQALFPGRVVAIETDATEEPSEVDGSFADDDDDERVPDDEAQDPSR